MSVIPGMTVQRKKDFRLGALDVLKISETSKSKNILKLDIHPTHNIGYIIMQRLSFEWLATHNGISETDVCFGSILQK